MATELAPPTHGAGFLPSVVLLAVLLELMSRHHPEQLSEHGAIMRHESESSLWPLGFSNKPTIPQGTGSDPFLNLGYGTAVIEQMGRTVRGMVGKRLQYRELVA